MSEDPFSDPALADTADRVRTVLRSGGIRPEFSDRLRAQLVAAAAARAAGEAGEAGESGEVAPEPAGPPDRTTTRPTTEPLARPTVQPTARRSDRGVVVPMRRPRRGGHRGRVAAWAAAATAAAAAGVVVAGTLPSAFDPEQVLVHASSALTGAVSADPDGSIRLSFDRPLDHASAQAALRLSPAAVVNTSWQGETMTVTPVHGLAPNSPYLLTLDARTARTATGAPLAADLRLAFGTAPAAGAAVTGAPATPATLERKVTSAARDASEAVVTRSGSLLLTGARTGTVGGLVRMPAGTGAAQPVSAGTDAICVSRSGASVAFLGKVGTGTGIVFADAAGTPQRTVPITVDAGSPLGWIEDDEVTFVSGGRLTATDRQGRRRVLWKQPVNAARQSLVLAPGGRYAYLGDAGGGGELIDLVTGTARPITGLVTDPAFTADGAGMVWADAAAGRVRLHHGPSDGGPATTAVLPVGATDRLSDLAVAPDGTRVVYSVTGTDHRAQLRLAALPSGVTLAASGAGAGESPNFSPTGRFFTVLAGSAGSYRIETVQVPRTGPEAAARTAAESEAAESVATAFALAQVGGDSGAQSWLGRPGLILPNHPRLTRAAVLWAVPGQDGMVDVRVRLGIDPQPTRPYPLQAEETVRISAPGVISAPGTGTASPPKVTAVEVGRFERTPSGPQLSRAEVEPGTGTAAGQVRLTFDSDLDAATVRDGVRLTRVDGSPLAATVRYDAATRAVRAQVAGVNRGTVVRISTAGVRDVLGAPAAAPVSPLEVRL